jgi:hypothetical protein
MEYAALREAAFDPVQIRGMTDAYDETLTALGRIGWCVCRIGWRTSEVLETVEAALDSVAVFVEAGVMRDLDFARPV